MSYLVVDTNVVIRKNGKHKSFFECLERTKDVVIISREILKEYESVARTHILMIRSMLDELRSKKQLKILKKGRIISKYKNNTRKSKPRIPNDKSDKKFILTAVACGSSTIISNDHHLKEISPIRWNGHECQVIEPVEYVRENCSDLL